MDRESSLGAAGERAHDLAPDTRVGRFVVTRRLGAGATGAVYEAEDPELRRQIALKLLRRPRHDDSPMLVGSLVAIAEVHLLQNRPDLARPPLERAQRYVDAPEADNVRARLQFALAQVLWPQPAERKAARAFADTALAAFRADEDNERIAAIETWRRANGVK